MKLTNALLWMFFGSIFIGIFLNGMNMLAYRTTDLYLSLTFVYSAILMASFMCILELVMFYTSMGNGNRGRNGKWLIYMILFVLLVGVSIWMLRQQVFVSDKQWLRRMISHHSTALTTSHKIYQRTKNEEIRRLAREIINTQEKEINIMKNILEKN